MNSRASSFLKTFLSVALAAVLLWYSFRGVDWKEFFVQLRACNWLYVLLSMAAAAAAYALRGVRWKALLDPLDPSIRLLPCINGINISNVGNLVIPYFGELLRCGVVTRHSRRDPVSGRPVATFDRVLGTAILERCWDILTVVLLLLVLLFARSGAFAAFLGEKIFQPMASSLQGWKLYLTLGILALLIVAIELVIRLRNRYPFCRRICDGCRRFLQGFSTCLRMKDKGLFFFYTALIWVLYTLQMVFIKDAMPAVASMDWLDCLFLMLIGSFATCLPVPGGFGAYHYIISSALLVLYGFPQAGVGIVFATLAHESQSLAMLLTGGASYLQEALSRRDR